VRDFTGRNMWTGEQSGGGGGTGDDLAVKSKDKAWVQAVVEASTKNEIEEVKKQLGARYEEFSKLDQKGLDEKLKAYFTKESDRNIVVKVIVQNKEEEEKSKAVPKVEVKQDNDKPGTAKPSGQ
jgi:hypothetical protein